MAIFAENGANMEIDLTIEQTGPHEAIPYELLYEADPRNRTGGKASPPG